MGRKENSWTLESTRPALVKADLVVRLTGGNQMGPLRRKCEQNLTTANTNPRGTGELSPQMSVLRCMLI